MNDYSAVVTTGIYCKPGCAGRPHPENVRHFQTAAAAEVAGFRACLRCRPYRYEPTVSVTGSNLVCRGVQLICDGVLDGGTEADLGTRLGVSPRHLRRLFDQHLGVTPDQLARSRRAHFARRLLDDTDLTVTEVAFAAGFGSVRQLNRATLEIFRANPSELRSQRRSSDRLVADGGLSLRIYFEPPLPWDSLLSYFRTRAIAGVETVSDDTYCRTIEIDGDPGVIELSPGGSDHLLLRAHLPHWEGLIHYVQRARRLFNLDVDTSLAIQHLKQDNVIGPLLDRYPGLRPPGTWDPYEVGIRAIVGQQISVAAANTIIARIVKRHGTAVTGLGDLGLSHLFPKAEVLARSDLAGLGLNNSRQRAIATFSSSVVDGTLDLSRSRELDQLIKSLTSIPGLGQWTAQYIALRMGEADAFPATDLGLRRTFASISGCDLSEITGRNWPTNWQPYRATAAICLWLAGTLSRQEGTDNNVYSDHS